MSLHEQLRGREAREFWISLEGAVTTFTGYACANSKTQWFVPGHGSTLELGVHLFDTREEAHEKAHQYLDRIEHMVRTKRRELPSRGTEAPVPALTTNIQVAERISDEAMRLAGKLVDQKTEDEIRAKALEEFRAKHYGKGCSDYWWFEREINRLRGIEEQEEQA